MSALIHLMAPVASGPDAKRVFYSVGRTLSQIDFEMQSRYVDARLLGLTPANVGVISGLGVSPASYSNLAAAAQNPLLTIGAGVGLGGDGRLVRLSAPLAFNWSDLIKTFGTSPPADGVYLLMLQTEVVDGFEGPTPDAASEEDPLLDVRQDSFVELTLSASLGALPPSPLTESGVDQALNISIYRLTPSDLQKAIGNGVPIALALVSGTKLLLLSQAAGRVAAVDQQLAALLLAQVRDVLAAAQIELGAAATADSWAPINQRLRYLPGACELPLAMLKAPSSFAPTCPFLPTNLTVFLQAIPSSQAQNWLAGALGRPAIDLQTADGSAVTLSLAIPDAAWTPTLLDEPYADPILPADLHLAYAAARAAEIQHREDWISLYGGMAAAEQASPQAFAFLNGADAAAANLAYLLGIGALQAKDLLAAADSLSNPPAFLSTVASWIAMLANAPSLAQQSAATAASVTGALYQALAPLGLLTPANIATFQAPLTADLARWPQAQSIALALLPAFAPASSLTGLALLPIFAPQASLAAVQASQPGLTPSGAALVNNIATAAAAAVVALGAGAANAAAVQAVGAKAAISVFTAARPDQVPAAPTPAAVAATLANLGYPINDPEPASFAVTTQPAPLVASDSVLTPLTPYLPPLSLFNDWTAEVAFAIQNGTQGANTPAPTLPPGLPTTPNTALLPPLIRAGVFSASDDAATQAAAFANWILIPNANDPAYNDATPGALLQLAALQFYYAVLGRVVRAHEYWLEGHGRLIALQRQHLDMMSTYVSAVAGGVAADGSGLGVTRLIPFFNLTPSAPTPVETLQAVAEPQQAVIHPRLVGIRNNPTLAGATKLAALGEAGKSANSVVESAQIGDTFLAGPKISQVGTLFGNQSDIAKVVAGDTSALSQGPQFSFSSVQYGTAAHITSGATLFQSATAGLQGLRQLMGQGPIQIVPTTALPIVTDRTSEAANYDAVIQTTRALLGDITLVENNAIRVEAAYLLLRDRVQAMQTQASQWTAAVAAARDPLRAAQAAAATAAGNYAAAQSLVAQETARVVALTVARAQVIGSATGLFMVRQLQTPIARRLFGAVTLVADTPQDVAPACAANHPGPPASLTPFLDLLLETTLGDWSALRGGWTNLPDDAGLRRLVGLRSARLTNFNPSTDFGAGAAAADLAGIAASGRGAIDPALNASFSFGASLALNQQAAFKLFSLPDLITLPANPLRANAEALRARMDDATGCLYAILTSLPPSARFAWASAARAGTFAALDFQQWPLPSGPTDATNTAIRQLAALVGWMASQLVDGASAAARTSLGNLVSAAVIASAYGDPDEAVTGAVVSAGGAPRQGWPIRVTLNRPPPIGTVLNLFDVNRNIVGTVKVQDHDSFGSSATVVSLFAPVGAGATLSVASQGGRSPWLSS
jgi:hypothetical protein